MTPMRCLFISAIAAVTIPAAGQMPATTLENSTVAFHVAEKPYVVLRRGDVTAVVVDNRAVDDEILPGHRAGYSGLASLTHRRRTDNLFVPAYAGLNFEHIHDGTVQERSVLFEPRHAPMELRVIDEHTVELYQAPSPHFGLESCQRYQLLEDGTVELTIECIPRRRAFHHNYIGLFWASYIHQPASLDIHFKGTRGSEGTDWVRGVTPEHGVLSTHLATTDNRQLAHADDFPLTLVFNRSNYRYSENWYFGVSHGMALVQMFRPHDQVRFSQSPSGGGRGNPAWDFQFLIEDYQVGQRYQMVMRAMYTPFESPEQIEQRSRPHRLVLSGGDR